jgi:hypothetical protein
MTEEEAFILMTQEESNLILALLREMRAERASRAALASAGPEIGAINSDSEATRSDVKSVPDSGRAALRAVFLETRKALCGEIDELRRTVEDYHAMALHVCPSLRRVNASAPPTTQGKIGE